MKKKYIFAVVSSDRQKIIEASRMTHAAGMIDSEEAFDPNDPNDFQRALQEIGNDISQKLKMPKYQEREGNEPVSADS